MTTRRTWAFAALSAALLMACGGGDPYEPGSVTPSGGPTTKGNFTALVTFGDSLSDIGTYTPATSVTANAAPPFLGGKFTTNVTDSTGSISSIWVENLATTLGLAVTPAEVGFAGQSRHCPVALANPALEHTCTAYGQGGSRVSEINGIGHSTGALTVPVTTQVANHLSRFTSFKDTDLVLVWAGANDAFTQLTTFGATAAQVQAQAAAGLITGDQANGLLLNAQLTAQGEMKKAALELAALIKTQVLAHGGKYVAVINAPDIGVTPFGGSLPAAVRGVLTGLSGVFNLWLREGLKDQPVQWIDSAAILAQAVATPAAFGFTNVTTPACDVATISALTQRQVTDGSSLFCNSSATPLNGLSPAANSANAATNWLFADSVHPTTGGHKAISDAFTAKLRGFGWIN